MPATSITRGGDIADFPLENWLMWRPKAQPSIMIASHGTTGYLTDNWPAPEVAMVNAAQSGAEPGGCHTSPVIISPNAYQATAAARSSDEGRRRRPAIAIIEIPIAKR